MLETGVIYLDVAIGVAVAFFLLSLIPSGINEAIAFFTRIRSKFLWAYLNQLFTAPAPETGGAGAATQERGLDAPAPPAAAPADSAAAKATRFAPRRGDAVLLASHAIAVEAAAAARSAPRPDTGERSLSSDDDLAARTQAIEDDMRQSAAIATADMQRSASADSAVASVGLPSTGWEMLSLMRASGVRDPRPALGSGAVGIEALPVVAELQRRLGPIAVAAATGRPNESKADKPTTTKHIPPRSLARAVVDLLSGGGVTDAQIAAKLDGLAGTPIHSTLVSLWTSTSGNLKEFGDELESWFDAEMARLSGLYKRLSRWVLAVAAVIVALLVNLDPIGLTQDLYRDPDRRADFVVAAGAVGADGGAGTAGDDAPSATPELALLYAACRADPATSAPPTGADEGPDVADAAAAVERVRNCVTDALGAQGHLGLLSDSVWAGDAFADSWRFSWDRGVLHIVKIAAVAAAIFFGAPFWWDVLRRLMGIRKTLVKPET